MREIKYKFYRWLGHILPYPLNMWFICEHIQYLQRDIKVRVILGVREFNKTVTLIHKEEGDKYVLEWLHPRFH